MKYLLALLLLLPNLAFASCKYEELNQISRATGVQIHCDFDRVVYFTEYPRSYCHELSAKNPQFGEINKVSSALMKFINSYPREIINKYLKNIYLLSDLQCDNLEMGGTRSKKSVYVSVYSGTSNKWFSDALHHEFSSILWTWNRFYMTEANIGTISGYAAYDPDSLSYCLGKGDCRIEKDELLRQGFLVAYNKTNIENDFNVYVEYLFTNREHLMQLASKYPLVDKKVKLFTKFYAEIGIPL